MIRDVVISVVVVAGMVLAFGQPVSLPALLSDLAIVLAILLGLAVIYAAQGLSFRPTDKGGFQ